MAHSYPGWTCQYEPCPSTGCEASRNHQRQDPRLCHQRHLREGQLRGEEHQVCRKPFLLCGPLFELAIMRDPLAITTFLWSRSARSNNLITGSAKEVTYSACSQHATRAVCTTNMYPHLSLPLIATPPPIEQCNSFKRGLFGGSICTYSLWLMPWWRRKTCLPTRLLFTRV